MKILLCIDDTDSAINKCSTEKIAQYIIKNIHYNKYGEGKDITKHYLLNTREVSYTKDNASYCIEADVIEDNYMDVIKDAEDIISENMAPESNPGICAIMLDKVFNKEDIIKFGQDAKVTLMKKSDALSLALRSGLYLKDRGGDGSGVIGALAGISLRLSGNDGIYVEDILSEEKLTVRDLKNKYNIDIIENKDGIEIIDDEKVIIKDKTNCFLKNNKKVLVVQ